ncbi:energy-coupling factor transporter transmembrane component T family protein [Mycetocola zhadangensis]|uniref:Energy-coupling factor transporter transmembrane protein EcfT n=1 Tax=Mycetocola zhadangensis TaxID=1164595 RepID=A0A3L7J2T5_9MICO|nr:energy-coupling factor transporter transmembrane component T [Mycetocola zhadangensis]RLQ84595.1 energy-coupling factor transporter transmembrane protein EcfT [Mycetocola zhadangensis]GGE91558.1 cobalt ABC transporter permease [Mycetocola zhadangensis]
MQPLGLYRPGSSVLHRAGAGVKLISLFVLALAASVPPPSIWLLGGLSVLVVTLYLLAGLGFRELARQILMIRWLILLVTVTGLLFLPLDVALANVTRMTLVIVLAGLVTLTTRTSALLDAFEVALSPLRFAGINPQRISLVLALSIRTVPVIAGFAQQLRDAQRSRGGRVSIRAFVVPLLVLSLRHSDDLADALIARGAD